MRHQLAAAVLMAVILATFMNMNAAMPHLEKAPSHSAENHGQDHNTTDDSVMQEKTHQTPSDSESFQYFAIGMLIIIVLVPSCHLIFKKVCKADRMHQRAFDHMLNNERHGGHRYDRVLRRAREPPTFRFPTHPEISLPLVEIPSLSQVYPQDPFFNDVQNNIRAHFERERRAPRRVRGPRRVTISSPCVTGTSYC